MSDDRSNSRNGLGSVVSVATGRAATTGGLALVLATWVLVCLASDGGSGNRETFTIDRSSTPGGEASESGPVELVDLEIGGDFALVDDRGETFRLADHRGEVFLLFFGYTTCPDFCPLTFSRLTQAYDLLGDQADQVTTLLLSVDPERDTPARLAEYLGFFDVQATGLTGTQEQIDEVVAAYAAFYEKVESESGAGALFGHSTYLYLIDGQGRVRYLFGHGESPERIASGVRLLLD